VEKVDAGTKLAKFLIICARVVVLVAVAVARVAKQAKTAANWQLLQMANELYKCGNEKF